MLKKIFFSVTPWSTTQLAAVALAYLVLLHTNPVLGEKPCAAADGLLQGKRTDKALEIYQDLIQKNPGLACAKDGLNRVATEFLKLGKAFEEAGSKDKAVSAYENAIVANPTLEEAIAALRSLAHPDQIAERHFQFGEAYEAAGDLEQARKEYLEAYIKNPQIAGGFEAIKRTEAPFTKVRILLHKGENKEARKKFTGLLNKYPFINIPDDLQYLTGPDQPFTTVKNLVNLGFHEAARTEMKIVLKNNPLLTVPEDLEYLSGGKIPIWRTIRRGIEPWLVPVGEILVMASLTFIGLRFLYSRGKTLLGLGGMPALEIEDMEVSNTSVFKKGRNFSILLINHLNRLEKGNPSGKIFVITGAIPSFKIPQDIQEAIPPSAKWALGIPDFFSSLFKPKSMKLSGVLHPFDDSRGIGASLQITHNNKVLASRTLWQRDFMIEPYVQNSEEAGAYYQLSEYGAIWLFFEIMTRFYKDSFSLLGTHHWRSYAFFRAGLHAQTRTPPNNKEAKALYVMALKLSPELLGARANLAWLLYYDKDIETRRRSIRQLAKVESLAREYKEKYSIEDPTLYSVMFGQAILNQELGEITEAREKAEQLITEINVVHQNNLGAENKPKNRWLHSYLASIRPSANALYAALKGIVRQQNIDKDSEDILLEEMDETSFSPSARFNLACAYSIMAKNAVILKAEEYLRKSLFHLDATFWLDEEYVGHAKEDPSLSFLRDSLGRELDQLIQKYQPKITPDLSQRPSWNLSKLHLINDEFAEKLAAANIHNQDDLLLEVQSPQQRDALARRLNVSVALVQGWANLVDLLRIVGLGPNQAKLLYSSGIRSINDLAQSDPLTLTSFLQELARINHVNVEFKSETVTGWIDQARQINPMVG